MANISSHAAHARALVVREFTSMGFRTVKGRPQYLRMYGEVIQGVMFARSRPADPLNIYELDVQLDVYSPHFYEVVNDTRQSEMFLPQISILLSDLCAADPWIISSRKGAEIAARTLIETFRACGQPFFEATSTDQAVVGKSVEPGYRICSSDRAQWEAMVFRGEAKREDGFTPDAELEREIEEDLRQLRASLPWPTERTSITRVYPFRTEE